MEFSAAQIAEFVQGQIVGSPEATVSTFSKIEEGKPGTLSFLSNPKYSHYIYDCQSSIILVNKDFFPEKEIQATLIKVDDAYQALAKLLALVEQFKPKKKGISPLAHISESAHIGENVYIAPFVYIGENVKVGNNAAIYSNSNIEDNSTIGNNTIIYNSVSIYKECVVGNNCILHSGAVIGADGFGFAPTDDGSYNKIPQLGNVVLEDDVEIGANTAIDRATFGSTVIRKGVKIDNLVQIAHNVEVGTNTVIAGQTGIAGSTKLGKQCTLAGQVGIAGHLQIADHTILAAQTGVPGSIKKTNQILMGTPPLPIKDFHRSSIGFKNLPEIQTNIHQLLKRVEELEQKLKSLQ